MGIGMTLGMGWGSIALGGGIPAAETAFVFTVQTDNAGTSAANQFTIPITSATPYNISTSDGQSITGATGATTLTFPSAGEYEIKISESCSGWRFANGGDRRKLLDISNWGVYKNTASEAFRGATNMTCSAIDAPLNAPTTMNSTFSLCPNFNGAVGNWDVSNVTDFGSCFYSNYVFNQPLNDWDVSSATTFLNLFYRATLFNQPLNNWDTSSVTSMNNMFSHPFFTKGQFNQDISSWDVSNVTNFGDMFNNTNFNQDLSSWDVSSLTVIGGMFAATPFNYPLNNWVTSSVTSLDGVFAGATSFNQDLSSWDVSNVTSLRNLFSNATSFNQDISGWNVSSVTNLERTFNNADAFSYDISGWSMPNLNRLTGAFGAIPWNPNISGWDVSNVLYMDALFYVNTANITDDFSGWNTSNVVTLESFGQASNFNGDISAWDVSSVTNLRSFMYGNGTFSGTLSSWDTSSVTTMIYNPFYQTHSYDDDLGGWDVSNVSVIGSVFKNGIPFSTANYDSLLVGWEASLQAAYPGGTGYPYTISVSFYTSTYTLGSAAETARTSLINTYGWTITDGGGIEVPFTFTVDTALGDGLAQFSIPTTGTGYNYNVVTSDGQSITGNTGNTTITFPSTGTYTIEVTGDFPRIYFNNTGDRLKLTDIVKWGSIAWTDLSYAFKGCSNMVMSAIDAPDLSNLIGNNAAHTFHGCTSFNSSLNHWDTSTLNYAWMMFYNCTSLNQDFDNWDVSNITGFQQMFANCISFNGNVSTWDVSYSGETRYMFSNCQVFNQDISSWDMSNKYTMDYMFQNCYAFNQNLSSWNLKTTGTVNLARMFQGAISYNNGGQPLTWNTSAVTNLAETFNNAQSFNADISSWDTSSVTDMSGTFSNADSFNQDISNWNVSSVVYMGSMFESADAFNQPIGSWDVSNVTTMQSMFRFSGSFNQPIDAWNTTSLTNMTRLFEESVAFNQPIDSWDISNVISTGLDWFLSGAKLFNSTIRILSNRPAAVVRYAYIFRGLPVFNQDVSYVDFNGIGGFVDEFYQCPSFKQSLSSWDITTMSYGRIFGNAINLLTANYDATLVSWEAQSPGWASNSNFGSSKYTLGGEAEAARTSLINTYGWTITDGGGVAEVAYEYEFQPWFDNIHTITTDPAYTYNYNVTVSTGETFTNQTGDLSITFADRSIVRTLQITGLFPATGRYVVNGPRLKYRIINWGSGLWRSLNSAFELAGSLTDFGPTVPNLQLCTSMNRTFFSFPFAANIATSNLNSWDVSNVTSMENCFVLSTGNQNLDISDWNTKNLTNALYMFSQSQFNGDITNWDVSSLTNASYMFDRVTLFNQNISSWNTSNVTTFRQMFYNTIGNMIFNQPIGSWNTSSATNMRYMLSGCGSFDQDISNWDINLVTDFTMLLQLGTLSTTNYDATLISWANQAPLTNKSISFGGSQYTLGGAAEAARNTLINTYGWTITDGGGIAVPLTTNLVASYNFDADFTDYTGNNPLTPSGGTPPVAGVSGGVVSNCAEFNSTGDYTLTADSDDFSFTDGVADLPFSVSFWANFTSYNAQGVYFLSKRDASTNEEYQIVVSQNIFNVFLFGGGGTANYLRGQLSYTPPIGIWHHYTVTYDGSETSAGIKLYIDGVSQALTYGSVGTYTGMVNGSQDVNIGSQSWNPAAGSFDGKLDEYHIWKDRELTSAEVTDIYTTELAGNSILPADFTTNLVASYNFDADFTDYTGNHPLTSSGNVTAGTAGGVVSNCSDFGGTSSDFLEALDSDDFSFTDGVSDLPFSVSMWVNFDVVANSWFFDKRGTSPNDEYQITYYSGSFAIALASQGGFAAYLNATYAITPVVGTWYHLTWTYDGSGTFAGIKLYIDGVSQALTNISVGTYVGMSNGTAVARFGKFTDSSPFNGKMDETHIWKNRELTAAEVTDIYTTELAGNSILP